MPAHDDIARLPPELAAGHTFVVPDARLMYVQVPKAACTSIKAWLLRMSCGTSTPAEVSAKPEVTSAMTVHDREVSRLASIAQLRDSVAMEALRSPAWFRFGVVRHPVARAVSAWCDKILLSDPVARFLHVSDELEFDDQGVIDLVASFRMFVHALDREWEVYKSDAHFTPQAEILRTDLIDYSTIARTDHMLDLATRLRAHFHGLGRSMPEVEHLNEGLSFDWRSMCDPEALEILIERYRADFDGFQFAVPVTADLTGPTQLTARETSMILELRARNNRIRELSQLARRREGFRWGVHELRRSVSARARLGTLRVK